MDALHATSERMARSKIDKLCDRIFVEEGVRVGITSLSYRGDNVWMYVLEDVIPDK